MKTKPKTPTGDLLEYMRKAEIVDQIFNRRKDGNKEISDLLEREGFSTTERQAISDYVGQVDDCLYNMEHAVSHEVMDEMDGMMTPSNRAKLYTGIAGAAAGVILCYATSDNGPAPLGVMFWGGWGAAVAVAGETLFKPVERLFRKYDKKTEHSPEGRLQVAKKDILDLLREGYTK